MALILILVLWLCANCVCGAPWQLLYLPQKVQISKGKCFSSNSPSKCCFWNVVRCFYPWFYHNLLSRDVGFRKWIFPMSKVLRSFPTQYATKVNLGGEMVGRSHWWPFTFYPMVTNTCIQPSWIFSEYSDASISHYHIFVGIQANQLFLQACHMNQKINTWPKSFIKTL